MMARALSKRQLLLSCVTQESLDHDDILEDEDEDKSDRDNAFLSLPTSPVCRVLEVVLL
jgi:hypothetical protein